MAQLEREIVVDATPSTIFPFLSEREQLLKWIGTDAEIDARPGGLFKVLVGGKHPSLGEFVEVVPDQKVAFTFGWDEPGHPIPAGFDPHRDQPHSGGREDEGPARAQWIARRRSHRPHPWLGALPRPSGHCGRWRRSRSRHPPGVAAVRLPSRSVKTSPRPRATFIGR